jgi:hypothetical protein
MLEIEKKEKIDPQVYFDLIKEKKHQSSDKFLNDFQDVIEVELSKAMKTGQNYMVRRLAYTMSIITRERQLIQEGIDVYILREDIEEYIKSVEKKVVKVIELENYPRSIPDEVVEKVEKLKSKNIFDRYYVVFTDYTGEIEKTVEQTKRKRDPIIFGAFEQKLDGIWDIFDRFYFIADWEDEYCDLTLAKMVDAMSKKKDIVNKVSIDKATSEEVKAYLNALEEKEKERFTLRPRKQPFFKRISTAWKIVRGK